MDPNCGDVRSVVVIIGRSHAVYPIGQAERAGRGGGFTRGTTVGFLRNQINWQRIAHCIYSMMFTLLTGNFIYLLHASPIACPYLDWQNDKESHSLYDDVPLLTDGYIILIYLALLFADLTDEMTESRSITTFLCLTAVTSIFKLPLLVPGLGEKMTRESRTTVSIPRHSVERRLHSGERGRLHLAFFLIVTWVGLFWSPREKTPDIYHVIP